MLPNSIIFKSKMQVKNATYYNSNILKQIQVKNDTYDNSIILKAKSS
jgi:hypothetical protein